MAAAENRKFATLNTRGQQPSAPAAAPTAPTAPTAITGIPSGPIALPIMSRFSSLYSSTKSKAIAGTALTLLFYTSLTVFILFLILVFVHFTMYPIFSFSAEEDGIISIPTSSDKQTVFEGVVATDTTSANPTGLAGTNYTVSFDVYLSGDFFVTTAPRTLLYRADSTAQVVAADTITPASILARYPDTNMLIWVDPTKNDLYVSAITTSNGGPKSIETLPTPVENIPIRKVFRLTIVYTDKFMEVYINGRLEKSMPLRGTPITQDGTKAFFPPPAFARNSVKISNLTFWPRPLRAREVKSIAGAPIANAPLFSPQVSS